MIEFNVGGAISRLFNRPGRGPAALIPNKASIGLPEELKNFEGVFNSHGIPPELWGSVSMTKTTSFRTKDGGTLFVDGPCRAIVPPIAPNPLHR